MDIEISERIKTIANQVKYRTIADIGTDHAYVPIYLCKTNQIDYAYACDINKAPLEKASANIKKYILEDKISTLLGSGLERIASNQVETVIISGMGGQLIIDILKNDIEKVQKLKQIILQPQLDIYSVRKYIHSIGFSIENEKMLMEDGKYYNIISAVCGDETYECDEEYSYGRILIERKDNILKKYLAENIEKYDKIVNNLNNEVSMLAIERKQELLAQIKSLKEIFKCL